MLNGKVPNVTTGVRAAVHEAVVIADDDVRHTAVTLRAVLARLRGADLVVPTNVFDPMPWHARWDTARTLVNRSPVGPTTPARSASAGRRSSRWARTTATSCSRISS
jgi:hypothetical protein